MLDPNTVIELFNITGEVLAEELDSQPADGVALNVIIERNGYKLKLEVRHEQ